VRNRQCEAHFSDKVSETKLSHPTRGLIPYLSISEGRSSLALLVHQNFDANRLKTALSLQEARIVLHRTRCTKAN
jgi:hypothetical protein